MPVSWNADKDAFLLVHISNMIKLNNEQLDGLIAAWPSSFGPKPTRRAISEHFVKLRSTLGKAGVGGYSKTGAKGTGSAAPVKKESKVTDSFKVTKDKPVAAKGGAKRKREDSESEDAGMTGLGDESDTDTDVKIKPDPEGQAVEGVEPRIGPHQRVSLHRSTKTPEKRRQQQEFNRQAGGTSSDESDEDGKPAGYEADDE